MLVQLACPSPDVSIQTSGVCSLAPRTDDTYVEILSDVAGTCHVEFSFPDAAPVSLDLQFTSGWLACGSDPHGCGLAIGVSPTNAQVGAPCSAVLRSSRP